MLTRNYKIINHITKIIPLVVFQRIEKENIIVVNPDELLSSLKILKTHLGLKYSLLSCISGVDLLNTAYRFCIVYDLLSVIFNSRIRLKIFIDDVTIVSSAVTVFMNSNWWEREIWDMYGIYFDKHPDLRRILTDYGFEGYPMRKDFPLYGFSELRYSDIRKRVVVEPIELSQDFRLFNFETIWEN